MAGERLSRVRGNLVNGRRKMYLMLIRISVAERLAMNVVLQAKEAPDARTLKVYFGEETGCCYWSARVREIPIATETQSSNKILGQRVLPVLIDVM